ncbi:VanZ family protein [Haliea sp. E17]|uniref:VanZ family protein n=1 Tax=Haliea sp. E17 TaxID=3401576 RepID=UPI003AAFB495
MTQQGFRILGALSPLFVLAILAIPGAYVEALVDWLNRFLSLNIQGPSLAVGWQDKLVHAMLFFAMAYCVVRANYFPDYSLLWLLPPLLAYAAFTEGVQYFVPRRVPSTLDFLADAAGVCAGMACACWWAGSGINRPVSEPGTNYLR